MYPTTIENDVRSIIIAETGITDFRMLDSSTRLVEIGFDVKQFFSRLHLGMEEVGDSEQLTPGKVVALLESRSEDIRSKLWEMATESRLLRIMLGTLATMEQPPVDEENRWWSVLTEHILRWYARHEPTIGLQLIQRSIPEGATQILRGLGLLEIDVLAEGNENDMVTFLDVLERFGYSKKNRVKVYELLVSIARTVKQQYDGRMQQVLRQYANQMADELSQQLVSGSDAPDFMKHTIRSWIGDVTTLPLSVWTLSAWSPLIIEFVDKVGVPQEMLISVADKVGIALPTAERVMAEFMDQLCRHCEPENQDHQYCIKDFATRNWQVECPARPDLAIWQ